MYCMSHSRGSARRITILGMALRRKLALLVLCLAAGCQAGPDAQGIDITRADFGCGYPLLTPLQTLQTRVNSSSTTFDLPGAEDRISVRVMTARDLSLQDPYQQVRSTKDLVYVIVGDPPAAAGKAKGMAIVEFRAYPIEGKETDVVLHGRKLRELDPDDADQLLQTTGVRTEASDATHSLYLLPYPPNRKLKLELTLSFQPKKGCYAAKLRFQDPAAKF
jgi:hypothetical protein